MKTVYIDRDRDNDEFIVKGAGDPESKWYFTSDRSDAIGTAFCEHGMNIKLVFRSARSTAHE